jgi:flagellar motor switch protein FliN
MPDDVLSQDDIDSLLQEVGEEETAEQPETKAAPKKGGESEDAEAWGLSEEEIAEGKKAPAAAAAQPRNEPGMTMEQFERGARQQNGDMRSLEFVLDIPLLLTVEVGRTRMTIGDLLGLGPGSIVELSKLAGEPLEVFVNNKLVARGEAVIVNEKFGIRLTDVISKSERIESLQ